MHPLLKAGREQGVSLRSSLRSESSPPHNPALFQFSHSIGGVTNLPTRGFAAVAAHVLLFTPSPLLIDAVGAFVVARQLRTVMRYVTTASRRAFRAKVRWGI